MKKWLSYHEQKLLGRPLEFGEVKAFTSIARHIAALLDANCARISGTLD